MKNKRSLYIVLLFIIIFIIPSAARTDKQVIGRYAFIVGSNYGGSDRVRLKYAISDANSMMAVLRKMGGVVKENSVLLSGPDRRTFLSSMRNMRAKLVNARRNYKRIELIFYYSGHSDEEGILLNGQKVNYKEIRNSIKSMPADVRIAILDSCSSGAFTRLKGGKMRAPFLMDSSYDMKGYAFMTSSSSNEAAQESDKIRGSFFTHYLVSGLRGAADMTSDGRITLNEAYQFAYNETLARTEKTLSGPQHPNYHIQMRGTGDVVITDIRKSSSTLVLYKNFSGKISIRDNDDTLVAELNKPYGRSIELGLEKGKYKIINNNNNKLYVASVNLASYRKYILKSNNFEQTDREFTIARGEGLPEMETNKYLLNSGKKIKHGFYAAPTLSMTHIGKNFALFSGAKLGWIANDQYVLGAKLNVKLTNLRHNDFDDVEEPSNRIVDTGYAGAMFEYYFFTNRWYNISLGVAMGGGFYGLDIRGDDKETEDRAKHRMSYFFAMEPEFKFLFNITKYFRMGVGISYRFAYGGQKDGIEGFDLSGVSGNIAFAFGMF